MMETFFQDFKQSLRMFAQSPAFTLAASPAKFQHFRQQTSMVQDVAAFNSGIVNYTGGNFPEQLQSDHVSADYFRLFGVPAELGRTFTAEEDRPNGERVVVLGHLDTCPARYSSDGGVPSGLEDLVVLGAHQFVALLHDQRSAGRAKRRRYARR
jgi:hypothetical protein